VRKPGGAALESGHTAKGIIARSESHRLTTERRIYHALLILNAFDSLALEALFVGGFDLRTLLFSITFPLRCFLGGYLVLVTWWVGNLLNLFFASMNRRNMSVLRES